MTAIRRSPMALLLGGGAIVLLATAGAWQIPLGAGARALAAGGALGLVGLLSFEPLVVRRAGRRLPDAVRGLLPALRAASRARLQRPVLLAGVVAVGGSVAVLADTVGVSGSGAGSVLGSRTGALLVLRTLLLAAATVVALGRLPRRRPAALALAGTGLLTFSLSSHAAATAADRPLAIGLDAVHLVAAAVWSGGVLALALGGLPAARDAGGRDARAVADLAGAVSHRFSVLAQLSLVIVLATGGYAALVRITSPRQLVATTWGTELTVKVALWVAVVVVTAFSALRVIPSLADRSAAATRRMAAAGELRSTARLELLLAGALVVVAALMSAAAQPSTPAAGAAGGVTGAGTPAAGVTGTASGSAGGYVADVTVRRSGTGAGVVTVFDIDLSTEGTLASAPSADAVLRGPDGVDRAVALELTGAGHWTSKPLPVPPGSYRMTARFERLGRQLRIPVTLRVP